MNGVYMVEMSKEMQDDEAVFVSIYAATGI